MNDHDLDHIRDQSYNHSEVGFERHRPRQHHHQHHPNNLHQHSQQQTQQQQPRTSRRQRSTSAGRSRQPVFQIRASNFVKKLGIFTSKFGAGARIKQSVDNNTEDTDPDAALAVEHNPFRKAKSMDVLRSKPYISSPMLAITGYDPQNLARKSADGSHESGSANASEAGELKSTHSRNLSDSNSSSIAQGLAVAAMVAEATSLRPASTSPSPAALHPEGSGKRRTPNSIASLSNGVDNIPTKGNNMNYSRAQNTNGLEALTPPPPVPEKRPGHPRLSTLPPLTLHVKGMSEDSRPQRFSPSVIVRPPPFPILELPALPTPIAETSGSSGSQSQSRSRRGTARLNSMPMLPREGSDARENDPDHENCVLDEDEEGDDEDNEDDGAATGENDAAGSEEDEDENEAGVNGRNITSSSSSATTLSPTASFLSRTRALSPRLQLPALNTPSLSSLLGNFTSGSSPSQAAGSGTGGLSASASHVDAHVGSTNQVSAAAEPFNVSRDDETTPKAVRTNHIWGGLGNGSARFDYFSTSGAPSRAATAAGASSGSGSGTDRDIDKTYHVSSDVTRSSSSSSFIITSTAPSPLQTQTPTARDRPASQTPMISVAPPPWSPSETSSPGVFGSETTRAFKDASFTRTKGAVVAVPEVPHLASIPIRGVADGQQTLKRPSIYHHASKSMIELFSTAASQTEARTAESDKDAATFGPGTSDDHDVKKGKGKLLSEEGAESKKLHSLKEKDGMDASIPISNTNNSLLQPTGDQYSKAGQGKGLPPTPTAVAVISGDAASAAPTATTLRRQQSMPTFSTSGPPPPYPSFPLPEHLRRFAPLPREDEGKEELPPYSNDIRLAAIMPRKMEFSAPGVPSRDRKWRRVHCVLEGTAFRVYDAPPRVTGVSALGGWWERKVGVGDVSSGLNASAGATAGPGATTNIVIGRKEPKRRMKWEEELQAEEEDARRASAESTTEEGQPRASVSSSTSTAELNGSSERSERPQAHKSKLHLAASLLHPSRSRLSLAHGSSSSPASPRSSFQSPRNSAEGSSPPSARPSVDLSTTPAPALSRSQSSALSSNAASSTSALSSSLSAQSSNSDASCTQARRRRHLRSDSAQSSNNSHSRSNSRTHSSLNPDNNTRSQAQSQNSSHSHSHSATSHLHQSNSCEVPEPDKRDLLRVYSLQRAESGLASDYMKRKNVVRVRMEGEQFLLQCKDVANVVEWIEALQAATNIALDLDERPMPKGPIFPRRRRRRRVQPTESGTQTQSASATDSGANATADAAGVTESSAAS
ncbi:hypothetical protein ACEPAG_8571 [Sanghuangporus baumii]